MAHALLRRAKRNVAFTQNDVKYLSLQKQNVGRKKSVYSEKYNEIGAQLQATNTFVEMFIDCLFCIVASFFILWTIPDFQTDV